MSLGVNNLISIAMEMKHVFFSQKISGRKKMNSSLTTHSCWINFHNPRILL